MNPQQLQIELGQVVRRALDSRESNLSDAIAVLEVTKLDCYMILQAKIAQARAQEKRILRPNGLGPMPGQG